MNLGGPDIHRATSNLFFQAYMDSKWILKLLGNVVEETKEFVVHQE